MLEASRYRGSRIATRSTRAAGFRGGNSSVAGNCYETFSESRRAVESIRVQHAWWIKSSTSFANVNPVPCCRVSLAVTTISRGKLYDVGCFRLTGVLRIGEILHWLEYSAYRILV